ncbi:cytochrome P450 [Marasmius fiardii PR-910]|nr:cytochrome P450 [Marasmius fiardii PR-910]
MAFENGYYYSSFFLGALLACALLHKFLTTSSKLLAPGPRGIPIFGNVLQVPTVKTWIYFQELASQYGSIFRLNLAGNEVLVLNSPEDAEELLGRRSHNYSSRPPLIYAGKYQSKNKRLVLLPYGKQLKRQRAAFTQMVQPKAIGGYEIVQEQEAVKLLYDMLIRPQDATRNSRRFAASLVFHLSYGGNLTDDDEDLDAVTEVLAGFVRDTYPGSHLVDSFPILDLLPGPFAPWRREALKKHRHEMKLYQKLALQVKQKMDQGDIGVECFAARLWDQAARGEVDLEELSYLAGSAFEAGTDTSTGTMQWFIMAMVLYPDTMRKARAELDSILGSDGSCMPGFSHFGLLPYCAALVKEVFRWGTAAPGGFPHLSDAADIPKNTMVIPCIYSMHHNEAEFPDSYSFKPERFLNDQGSPFEPSSLLEGHYSFGFGRRKCPGQHLGAKSIWIGVVRLLWAFDISPQTDTRGNVIKVDPNDCTSGMTSRPNDFPFKLTPRSENHRQTIMHQWSLNQ